MTDIEILEYWYKEIRDNFVPGPTPEVIRLRQAIDNLKPDDPNKIDQFSEEFMAVWPDYLTLRKYGFRDKSPIEPVQVKKKMKTFFKDFKKNTGLTISFEAKKELIMEATIDYMSQFEKGRTEWTFLSDAGNFINHQGKGSKLLAAIIKLKNTPKSKRDDSDFMFSKSN